MSITIEEWKDGLKAWQNVKKQANIDLEQAELYSTAIQKKIEELEQVKQDGE